MDVLHLQQPQFGCYHVLVRAKGQMAAVHKAMNDQSINCQDPKKV